MKDKQRELLNEAKRIQKEFNKIGQYWPLSSIIESLKEKLKKQ